MKKNAIHTIQRIIFGILLLVFQVANSQANLQNETNLKAKAAEYFLQDNYSDAFPLYSQLLSLDPKNPELNYRFGVCMMFTQRANPEEPLKYLEKAINQISDVEFYYFLALAYQNNYFFTDAITNYKKYLQLARNKVRKDWEVERKIAMCQNGMEMLKTANDLYVMEKSDVERKTFYRSYDLNQFGGRFLNLPEEFLSKADLKNEQGNVSYFNPQAKLLFYALENKGQKDIYYRLKQDNNEWSEAILLNNSINSIYDENYPFFMPDGKTLYFSSKGHNTMGGYDIFKSVYDSVSNQWSKAQNLSFPINTPSDDIMFITDANETMAWFASTRNSSNNLITVYKVGIIKKNPEATDLSGIYSKDKLAETDLGQIKNMAHLDINISNKAFQEIPFSQKQKLESLKKIDPARISQNIHQANLNNINKQIAVQEMQAGLSDSIKGVLRKIDFDLEALKTQFFQTQNFVNTKSNLAKQGQSEVSLLLEKAQETTLPERRNELIDQANKTLFSTLRNAHQSNQLIEIHQKLGQQIEAKRLLSENANMIFGDIQKHILTRNESETKKSITQLKNELQEADTLTDYTKAVDFSKGELIYPNYPSNLSDETKFMAFALENASQSLSPIVATETPYSAFLPATEKIAEIAKPMEITNRKEQHREQLIDLNQALTDRINELKYQSNILTKKAGEKLDKSNSALLEFEQMREDYFAGKIKDQTEVLAKQTESQNMLYQSLALKNYAEKTDSAYNVEIKLKEQITEQIFAIEQAWHSNQPEKAESLFRALQKNSTESDIQSVISVQSWIEKDNKNIPAKKEQANLSFINSQTLTDESIKLLLDAQKTREEANKKPNAFKRRELIMEAENKEKEAIQKQNQADKQLAVGTKLYEVIKKAEAIFPYSAEFEPAILLTEASKPILNPEKRKEQLNERLELRENEALSNPNVQNTLSETQSPHLNKSKLPAMNDAMAYETKHYQAQLLAEDLDINKRETVFLIQKGKTLKGEESIENERKISQKRSEADSLQTASTKAFAEAKNIYNQLPAESKKEVDNNKNDFENYLNNVRKRIAQLLDDVTILSQQAGQTTDENSKQTLIRQADEKEQVAMFLILEEFEIIAQRNRQNYRKNALTIESLFRENLSLKEKELMKAIFAQIENLNLQAEKKRLKAKDDALSFTLKKVLLQDAFSIESSALDLQLEAIRMIRENDVEGMLAYQPKEKQAEKPALIEAQKLVSSKLNTGALANSNQKQAVASKATEKTAENNVLIKEEKPEIIAVEKQENKPEILVTAKAEEKPEIIAVAIQENKSETIVTAKAEEKPEIIAVAIQENKSETILTAKAEEKPEIIAVAIQENKSETILTAKAEEKPEIIAIAKQENKSETIVIAKAEEKPEIIAVAKPEEKLPSEIAKTLNPGLFEDTNENKINRSAEKLVGIEQKPENKTQSKLPENHPVESVPANATTTNKNTEASAPIANKIFPIVSLASTPAVTQFSVQIAAINQHTTTNNFLNVIELFAIKDEEKSLYRYFSGKFTDLTSAIIRRNSLREQGYSDAFIKTWKDGKSVSINEAIGHIDEATQELMNKTTITLPSQYKNINFSASNINQLPGTYYSVQVGVYSRPRTSNQLFGIQPLFHNRTKNGLWVYFNGVYKNINEAEKNKANVNNKGIPDAFIVAFDQGEKVPIEKAQKAIQEGAAQPSANDIINLKTASVNIDKQLISIGRTTKSAGSTVYKIQIGVYSQAISMDWVAEDIPNGQKVDFFVNEAGKYVYTIGNFQSYEEAAQFNKQKIKALVKDAFVVSF